MCTCARRYTVQTGWAAMAMPTVTPSASQARLALRNALTNQVMTDERASAVNGSSESGTELEIAPLPIAAIGAQTERLGGGPGPEQGVPELQRRSSGETHGGDEVRLGAEPALSAG